MSLMEKLLAAMKFLAEINAKRDELTAAAREAAKTVKELSDKARAVKELNKLSPETKKMLIKAQGIEEPK